MKILRTLAWVGFIGCIAFYVHQYCNVLDATGIKLRMLFIDFVPPQQGSSILHTWLITPYHTGNVLQQAVLNTKVDYLFIVCYVAVMFMLSYHQMQNKTWVPLNTLLRLNLFLCFITGLLDFVENIILFRNFHHAQFNSDFVSPQWVSWPKFIIAAWIILIWLISLVTKNDTSKTGQLTPAIT